MSVLRVLEIPYGVSLDGLMEVIAAWNRADATEKAQSAKEVAEKAEFKTKTIERQHRFLLQLGFLEKEGKQYKLNTQGSRFAMLADYEQNDEFFEEMRDVLLGWSQIKQILNYLGMKTVDKEKIVSRIMMYTGRPSGDKNAKMGSETLLDLLVRTDIVEYGENKEYSLITNDKQESEISKTKQKSDGPNLTMIQKEVIRAKSTIEDDIVSIKITAELTIPVTVSDDRLKQIIHRIQTMLESLGFGED